MKIYHFPPYKKSIHKYDDIEVKILPKQAWQWKNNCSNTDIKMIIIPDKITD